MENDIPSLLHAFYKKALMDESSPEATILWTLSVLQDAYANIDNALDPRTGRFLPISLEALSDSLNKTLLDKVNYHHDRIYRLLKFLEQPIEYIINSPRDRIIRNHELTSPENARGFDSRSVRWLIKRPGKTAEEKLLLTRKVLAVKREFVLDTSENRLFKEILKTIKSLIELRIEIFEQFDMSFEHRLLGIISKWLRDNSDIGPWDNLPPNNILLQDKHYRKIWDAWGDIRVISEHIKNDVSVEKQYKIQILFLVLLATLQKHGIRFCSQPFKIDYNFDPTKPAGISFENIEKNIDLHGLAKLGDEIRFAFVHLRFYDKQLILDIGKNTHIEIINDRIELDSHQISLKKGNPFSIVKQLIDDLVEHRKIRAEQPPVLSKPLLPSGALTVDFNAGFPIWSTFEKVDQPLPYYHARQYWKFDQQQCSFPLSFGQIWQMHPACKTYSMANLLWNNIPCDITGQVADDLVADLFEKKSLHDEITVLLPDILDDLDDNSICLKRSIESFLPTVLYLPSSIAAVFAIKDLWGKVKNGDSFFIFESFDSKLTVTQVTAKKTKYSQELQECIPESCGIIWERHHTEILHNFYKKNESIQIENLTTKILTPVFSNKHWEFPGQKEFCIIHTIKESEIKYLYSQSQGKVRFIILSPGIRFENQVDNVVDLTAKHNSQIRYISRGGEILRTLSKVFPNNPLWTDDLPALSIQVRGTTGGYQNIELVSENHVPVTANRRKEILLTTSEYRLALSAGQSKHGFLLRRKTGKSTDRYHARVFLKNPPSHDILCHLRLYYTYGAAEPYRLEFVPLNQEQAGFRTVNAQLSKDSTLKEEDFENPYAAPSFDFIQDWDKQEEILSTIKRFIRYDVSWWTTTKNLFTDKDYLQTHSVKARISRPRHIFILAKYDVPSDHGRIPVYEATDPGQDKHIFFECHKTLFFNQEYEALFEENNEFQFSFDKVRCIDGFNYELSADDNYIQGKIKLAKNCSINSSDCSVWNFSLVSYNSKRGITYIGAISNTAFKILRGVCVLPGTFNQNNAERFLPAITDKKYVINIPRFMFSKEVDWTTIYEKEWHILLEPDLRRIMLIQEQPVSELQFNDAREHRCEECIRISRSLFAGERKIWAANTPISLKIFFEKNANGLFRLLTEEPCNNDFFFSHLGRFITFFGTSIPENFGCWIANNINKNSFLYLFYGLSIGKMEKLWQKNLWNIILEKWYCIVTDNKSIDALIRVSERVLRYPELISTLSYDDGKRILKTLKIRIESLTREVVSTRKYHEDLYAEHRLCDLLWLLMVLLRLRKSEDDKIKNLLYPGNLRDFSHCLQILLEEKIDFQIFINGEKKSMVSELVQYFDGSNPDTIVRLVDEDD